MEDYVHFLLQLVDHMPDVLFLSAAFPTAFQAALTCLELPSDDILFAALDLIRNIVGHDSVHPTDPTQLPPPKFPLYAQAIREAVGITGQQAVKLLMNGLVSSFSQDMTPLVMSIILTFARLWPQDLASWMAEAVAKLPANALPPGVAEPFLADFTT